MLTETTGEKVGFLFMNVVLFVIVIYLLTEQPQETSLHLTYTERMKVQAITDFIS